jgi:tetratricopeptide (TPR) repeat protein
VLKNGTVPASMASQILKGMPWEIKKSYLMKNDLMIMDIIATNNWERPIYFAITVGDDSYLGLDNYFQLEGLAYRLIPVNMVSPDGQTGRINTDIMYENMVKKFKWGGVDANNLFMDENNLRMTMNFRNNFARLCLDLIKEGKKDKATEVLNLCLKVMPKKNVPYNYFMIPIAECMYQLDRTKEANDLIKELADIYEQDLNYYFRFKGKMLENIENEVQQAMSVFQRMLQIVKMNQQKDLEKNLETRFNVLQQKYMGGVS